MADQIPFGDDIGIADNPEPRLPCVLLLDVSKSMAGPRIASLNEGLKAYRDELLRDSLAAQRVEVAIVTFGGRVETVCPFVTVDHFQPPTLKVGGNTPMGQAIVQSVETIDQRKQFYRQQGLAYFRPWIFLITDGGPTDGPVAWERARQLVRQGEETKKFAFFAVGVEGAKFDMLAQVSVRQPLRLQGLKFQELFVWLSQSQGGVSHSSPGLEDGVSLRQPTGWASL